MPVINQDYSENVVWSGDFARRTVETPVAGDDYVEFLDATDGLVKRCLISALPGGGGGGGAPTGASYIVASLDGTLTNEHALTNTSTVEWDTATAGVVTASIPNGGVTTLQLGGDITTAGKALLDDADAAAQRTTLGLAAVASTASASDITTGTLGIARIPTGTTSSTVCIGNDSRLSDDRTANGLRTDTTIVDIASSPAPTAGQVLVATSDISAKWDTLASGGSSIAFADAPMSNTAINVTTYTALVSKSVTVTAGDQFEIEAYGTLLNNSGTTATYRWQIALGSFTMECIDGTTVPTGATNRATFKVKGVFAVASTSSAGATLYAERNAVAGANAANSIATTTVRYGFNTSGSDLTGTQTIELRARSSLTTATQTLQLFSWSIRQVAQQL